MDQPFSTSKVHNLEFFQHASNFLEKCLLRDSNAPSLIDQMNITPKGAVSVSGLSDQDYPDLQAVSYNLAANSQIKLSAKVPLPPEITQNFNHMQCHCMMGLFTKINRAWLTIDSDIYVWTYEDGGDVSYYDGLTDTILCVGLIKPKPGVFNNFIKYLLVLATAVDIIVLGVTFSSHDENCIGEIQVVPDPIFTIATDGSIITVIKGTNDGRIFLGTRDGCIWEVYYQAESTWFGKRCKKINHSTSALSYLVPSFAYAVFVEEDCIVDIQIDNSRHILYTLTEKGAIEVYDLGEDGNDMKKIYRVPQNHLVQAAHKAVKTLDNKNFYPVVAISPIEKTDSSKLNLMAVSQTGVRFYFTTTTRLQSKKDSRPTTLTLLHVRVPPGIAATTRHQPKAVNLIEARDRNNVMISTSNEKDTLWNISSDMFAYSNILMESYNTIDIDGPVFAIEEMQFSYPVLKPPQRLPPLYARQHSEPPRKIIILTAQGVYFLTKLRPVDLIMQLLLDTQNHDSGSLQAFFSIIGEEEACATSLILASLQSATKEMFGDLARAAFFKFGGKPTLKSNPNTTLPSPFSPTAFTPKNASTPVLTSKQISESGIPAPPFAEALTAQHLGARSPTFNVLFDTNSPIDYSYKHNGLYIYASRILRPLWNLACLETVTIKHQSFVKSTLSSDDCSFILNHLSGLCNFLQFKTQVNLNKNVYLLPEQRTQAGSHLMAKDAEIEEYHSLECIRMFLNHVSQILGLWKVLCEHQFQYLIVQIDHKYLDVLKTWCFKDLFLNPQEVCMALLNVLINSYLADNASVDFISSRLRDVCPDLYKVEDATCSKANEILKTAKSVHNVNEKEELLKSALALCKNVAPGLNLQSICEQFISQQFYFAVVDLVVTSAKKCDPDKKAENYYYSQNENDQEGYQIYCRRMEMYQKVLIVLETVYNQSMETSAYVVNLNVNQSASNSLNENNIKILREIIWDILSYPDELLHMVTYEWMLSRQMHSEMITIKQNSLEKFLIKASKANPNNIKVLDVLWKYYENNHNHALAAEVLCNLAIINNDLLSFKERINYLAHALMCLRNEKVGFSPCLGKFLSELEEKLEIAQVQEAILEAIANLKGRSPNAETAEMVLNTKLFDLTQLYEDFADKFDLWECKLAIINCAGHTDYLLVENIWRNILQDEIGQATSAGNDALVQILYKVTELGKKYKNNDNCMPLEYLVPELEMVSAKLKADPKIVPKMFIGLGYPLLDLLNVYNKSMYLSAKHTFWLTQDDFHYPRAICFLIETFLNTQHKLKHMERRKLISASQDTIVDMLSTAYSKLNTEELVLELKRLQAKLDKL